MTRSVHIALSGLFVAVTVSMSLMLPSFGQNNYAQSGGGGFRTEKKTLPDASQFYKAPRQAQILDERMTVTDHRRPEVQPNIIQINPGPVPVIPGTTTVIGNPAGAGVGGGASSPVRMNQNLNSLPAAGFQSNYNPGRGVANNLPSGTSTGVHSLQKVNARLSPKERLAAQKNTVPVASVVKKTAQPPAVLNYKTTSTAAPPPAYATTNTNQNVQGRLIKRLTK